MTAVSISIAGNDENVQRSDSLSLMMRAVELKVESDPDLYFPRFIQALRWSYLDYLADMLEQQARALPEQEVPGIYSVCRALITIHLLDTTVPYDIMYCIQSYLYKI